MLKDLQTGDVYKIFILFYFFFFHILKGKPPGAAWGQENKWYIQGLKPKSPTHSCEAKTPVGLAHSDTRGTIKESYFILLKKKK